MVPPLYFTPLEELMMVKAFPSKLERPKNMLQEIKDNLKAERALVR